ncbi:MAG: hypothetical protein CFE32_21535, partial [Alphaproteobacteria bacterium PA3]
FYNYECDVGSTEQVDELAKVIHNEVANVDILVHAAAISDNATIFETSAERFGEIYYVNVGGAVRLIQKFAPNMINRKMGSIILLSSINADFATPTLAAYAASKGALNNLTKTAALELAPLGVRVNAIEDVASLALFLASDQSSWITGSIYLIDGGAHVTRR